MSNPRFSLNDTAVMLKHIRVATDARDMGNGLTVSRAFTIAERTLEKLFQERHPGPPPAKPREENVPPRVPCTTHREKSFKFSDGTVIRACSHDECGWGRTTKKHSDGMMGETLYAFDVPDARPRGLRRVIVLIAAETAATVETYVFFSRNKFERGGFEPAGYLRYEKAVEQKPSPADDEVTRRANEIKARAEKERAEQARVEQAREVNQPGRIPDFLQRKFDDEMRRLKELERETQHGTDTVATNPD